MQRQRSAERPLRVVIEDAEPLEREGSREWGAEAGRLLHLSIPLSVMSVLTYLGRMITLSQVGALGALQQSSMALANTLFNITGLSLVMGIATGAETFMGQAMGMRQYGVLGLVLQRAVLLSWAAALLPLAAWTHARQLLLALGQQAELARLAGGFVQLLSPALLLGGLNTAVTLYLAMQGVVRPLTLAAAVVAAATPLVNSALISRAGLGLSGAALGVVCLHGLQAALLVSLAVWQNRRCPAGAKPWTGLSHEALRQVPAYLAVAVPGTGMMVVDWWAFEVLTLVAGLLPDASTAVGAAGILFGIHVLCFFCVEGVGYAVKIRVAHLLGAGRAAAARRALLVGLCLGAAWAAVLAAGVLSAPRRVAGLFSSDPAVVATVVSGVPWMCVVLSIGNAATVMSGALRGCGRQRAGFLINGAAFWGAGVPAAAALALRRRLGVRGLWMGLAAGAAAQLVALGAYVSRLDWESEVARSRDLVKSQSSAGDEVFVRAAAAAGGAPCGARSSGGGGREEAVPLLV
ncbi:MAG: mate-domain-containing protein [Monoraphidium minutum]|nr:MAG: mate-domain-containing protein [Monoraphidium minutum]